MSAITDRINKLLSMAQHERSNEHEAEVALKMAERMMRQHNIDIADLETASGKATAYSWATSVMPIGERASRMTWRPMWIGFLAGGIGKFCDCKVIWSSNDDYGHCIKFQGEEHDIEYCAWLFKRLRDSGYAEAYVVTGKHRDTFRNAFAIRLQDRMNVLRKERDTAMREATTITGNALVVVQNKLALRDAEFGRARAGKAKRVQFASDVFHQGRAAADKAIFSRPIGQSSQRAICA